MTFAVVWISRQLQQNVVSRNCQIDALTALVQTEDYQTASAEKQRRLWDEALAFGIRKAKQK